MYINSGFKEQQAVRQSGMRYRVSLKSSTKHSPFSILSVLHCLVSIVSLTGERKTQFRSPLLFLSLVNTSSSHWFLAGY